ncbi:hypothetical protein BDR22DRAFT_72611, partial [Usnea florida]
VQDWYLSPRTTVLASILLFFHIFAASNPFYTSEPLLSHNHVPAVLSFFGLRSRSLNTCERSISNSFLDLTDQTTLPPNCCVAVNDIMPPPHVMKARQIGLYNPNKYVRGIAVQALGKVYGVNAVEKARTEESQARARVEEFASAGANVPYATRALTSEELAAHSEFTVDDDYEEKKEEEEEPAAVVGEPVGSGEEQREEIVPVAGAGVAATATAEEEAGDKPVEQEKKQKKEEKQKEKKVSSHRTIVLILH